MRFSRIWRYAANSRHFDEEGFTLIELTISIVILVIVIGSITLALMTVLMLSGGASNSASDSSDAQVVSATLTTDVQSSVEITTSDTSASEVCGTGTQLLGLEWDRLGQWEGTWASTRTYGKGTTVQHTGSAYISRAASNQNNTPTATTTSYWSVRAFNAVISYMAVQRGSRWELFRDQCTSGYSTNPTNSELVSSDICEPVQGCTQRAQQAPSVSITPTAKASAAATGWTTAADVDGVSLRVYEPRSHYSYTLEAEPAAGIAPASGTAPTVVSDTTGCGYATPGSGTYAQTLCFVNFATYTYVKAANGACQTITEGITGTPFKLSFCLSVEAGSESNDEAPPGNWAGSCNNEPGYLHTPDTVVRKPTKIPADLCTYSSADVVAVPFPTYADPPTSESFLGDDGFYTGVPGDPALYEYLEGTAATLYFTNIEVLGPKSVPATDWELITGDAESTDPGESLTWSTCPATDGKVQTNPSTCTGLSSPLKKFSIVENNPSTDDYFGNDCMNTAYTNTFPKSWLRYGALAVNDSFASTDSSDFTPAVRTQAQEVECAAGVASDKTGTVMLEAPEPSDLTVNMVGAGLQGIFVGFLL